MSKKWHEAAYRPILKKAWQTVRTRHELWFLGIFAAVMGTGAVLEVVFHVTKPVNSGFSLQQIFLDNIIPGFDAWRLWFIQLTVLEPWRVALIVALMIAVVIALVAIGVCSQHGLIKGTLSRSRLTTKDLLVLPKRACWKIFLIDVVTKIMVAIMLAVTAVPLALISSNIFTDIAASFVVLIIFMTIMIVISMVSILSIASVSDQGHGLHDALIEAWSIFRRHPLATFETALVVFLIHIIGGSVTFLVIMLLWIPYLLAYLAAVLTTTTALTAVVSLVTAGIMLGVIILAGGVLTAYQYAVWALVYKKLRTKKGFIPKLHRFRKTFKFF